MSTCALKFSYDSVPELHQKLSGFLERNGYRVEKAVAPMVTVAQLSRDVGRKPASVSRSLHRPSSPPFDAVWGQGTKRRRIIKIRRTPELLAYLSERRNNFSPTI